MKAWQSHPTSLLYKGWFLLFLCFFSLQYGKNSLCSCMTQCELQYCNVRRCVLFTKCTISRSRCEGESTCVESALLFSGRFLGIAFSVRRVLWFFFFQHEFIIMSVKVLFCCFFSPFPFYYEHDHDCKYVSSFTWKNCNNACRVEWRGRM